MKNNDLAICILFFNKLAQTKQCIDSVMNSGLNIYVLDNGSDITSHNEILDYYKNCKNIIFIESKENLGVARGRNKLLKCSKEKWLFFIDNDIVIEQADWLNIILSHINNPCNVEVFIPLLFNKREKSFVTIGNCEIINNHAVFSIPNNNYVNTFPGGASIVNRNLFDRLGIYDEDIFVGFEDIELAIRGIKQESPIRAKCINDVTLIHNHTHQSSKEDINAVKIRYDLKKVNHSYDLILKKHGIYLDSNYEQWNHDQIMQLTFNPFLYFLYVCYKKAKSILFK